VRRAVWCCKRRAPLAVQAVVVATVPVQRISLGLTRHCSAGLNPGRREDAAGAGGGLPSQALTDPR